MTLGCFCVVRTIIQNNKCSYMYFKYGVCVWKYAYICNMCMCACKLLSYSRAALCRSLPLVLLLFFCPYASIKYTQIHYPSSFLFWSCNTSHMCSIYMRLVKSQFHLTSDSLWSSSCNTSKPYSNSNCVILYKCFVFIMLSRSNCMKMIETACAMLQAE